MKEISSCFGCQYYDSCESYCGIKKIMIVPEQVMNCEMKEE